MAEAVAMSEADVLFRERIAHAIFGGSRREWDRLPLHAVLDYRTRADRVLSLITSGDRR